MTRILHFRSVQRLGAFMSVALGIAATAPAVHAVPQIRDGTYLDSFYKSCTNNSICSTALAAVPAGKTLVVRMVSCRIVHTGNANQTARYLFFSGGGRTVYLTPGTPVIINTTKEYNSAAEVFMPIVAGQLPVFYAAINSVVASITLTCSIAGELKP